jgi:hypothetical protein
MDRAVKPRVARRGGCRGAGQFGALRNALLEDTTTSPTRVLHEVAAAAGVETPTEDAADKVLED